MTFIRPNWESPKHRQRVVHLNHSGTRAWLQKNEFVTLHGPACKAPSEADFGQTMDTIFGGNIDSMQTPFPPIDPVLASFCSESWRFKL